MSSRNATARTDRGYDAEPASVSPSLAELRREIIEARNQAIKTDNLVKNLSAEIKQIARRQEGYQRRYLLNSAVAYVLFVGIIFTGLYLAFNAWVGSARQEVAHFQARNATLETRVDELERDLQQRRESENRAYAFWELLQSGSPDEVVEQFTEVQLQISNRAMIELFRDRVSEINYGLAEEAFRSGLVHVQAERWSEARDALLRSLNHVERTPWQPELYYNLGYALYQLEDFEGALHYFDEALTSEELDSALAAMASYRRGFCLESTGRLAEAVDAFRQYRSNFSAHRYTGRALHRINSINRELERRPDSD